MHDAILASTAAERLRFEGLETRRVDLISAGVVFLATAMECFDFEEMTISEWALREGILLETIDRHDPADWSSDPRAIRGASVVALARRCNWHEAHARRVATARLLAVRPDERAARARRASTGSCSSTRACSTTSASTCRRRATTATAPTSWSTVSCAASIPPRSRPSRRWSGGTGAATPTSTPLRSPTSSRCRSSPRSSGSPTASTAAAPASSSGVDVRVGPSLVLAAPASRGRRRDRAVGCAPQARAVRARLRPRPRGHHPGRLTPGSVLRGAAGAGLVDDARGGLDDVGAARAVDLEVGVERGHALEHRRQRGRPPRSATARPDTMPAPLGPRPPSRPGPSAAAAARRLRTSRNRRSPSCAARLRVRRIARWPSQYSMNDDTSSRAAATARRPRSTAGRATRRSGRGPPPPRRRARAPRPRRRGSTGRRSPATCRRHGRCRPPGGRVRRGSRAGRRWPAAAVAA